MGAASTATFMAKDALFKAAAKTGLPPPEIVRCGRVSARKAAENIAAENIAAAPMLLLPDQENMSPVEIFETLWARNAAARAPLEMSKNAGRLKAGECLYVRPV